MLWHIGLAMILLAVAVAFAPLGGYYLVLTLARANIFWTIVEQGWCRIVLRWGEYQKILRPGFRWVGIPGAYSLYKRKMTFLKSITDEQGNAKAEPHNDNDISSFKTTEYPYALPFKDEEDCHALNLSGVLAVFAVIADYRKAFFEISDWYAEMNNKILKVWRDLLVTLAYDSDIVGRSTKQAKNQKTISALLWEALSDRPNGKPSVLDQLLNTAGIKVNSVELVSIDPPAGWRDTTLAPYKAEREKAAAVHQAETSAILFDDTNQALKTWLTEQRAAGNKPTKAEIKAKQEELYERALAKTSGWQQLHIRGLENASTAVVGGANTGLFVGGGKSGDSDNRNPKGGAPKTNEQKAQEFFEEYGKYPKWDNLKRTPN